MSERTNKINEITRIYLLLLFRFIASILSAVKNDSREKLINFKQFCNSVGNEVWIHIEYVYIVYTFDRMVLFVFVCVCERIFCAYGKVNARN